MDGKIRQIFNSMDYGNVAESASLAQKWFKENPSIYDRFTHLETEPDAHEDVKNINTGDELGTVYTHGPAAVAKILESTASCKEWANLKSIQRAKILNNFAKEITANAELISQIEVCARGILSRDTKTKSLPLLIDYLVFYSNFAAGVTDDLKKGLVVAHVSANNFLGILAFIFGPALAAGHNLVIHAETRLTFVVFLLIELSIKAGIPNGTIRLIPNSVKISVLSNNDHVNFLAVFGRVDNEVNSANCNCNKRLLLFSPLKIPALVFNNADINSACDSLIKSIWSHQGMLPYSTKNIFVQEDILETFLKILKERLKKLKLSASNEKVADITYPSGSNTLLLKQAIQRAKQDGIEIFQPGSSSGDYLPTVFIGGFPDTDTDAPYCVILAFRTINEAVALANNNKQGFGAVVWTENVSLANEVCKKLKVANIWINTEGVLNPSVSFSSYKESGKGYFGGQEGLNEYLATKCICITKQLDTSFPNEETALINTISASKKAQETWSKSSLKDRIQLFKSVANSYSENGFDELIYKTILQVSSPAFPHVDSNYIINTLVEPLGVLAIKAENDSANSLILSAILLGNSVIILSEGSEQKEKYERLVKVLAGSGIPKDVAVILEYTENRIKLLQLHKEVTKIFSNEIVPNVVPLKNIPKNYPVVTEWSRIVSNVVLKKTVWSTIGQSFI